LTPTANEGNERHTQMANQDQDCF